MFDLVADRYDLLNDVLSLGQDRLWRRVVARTVSAQAGELVLDLAAGTGDVMGRRHVGGGAVARCVGGCWARNTGRRDVPAAARSDRTSRSTETIRTPSWTRSTPRARTTHRTGRAPWRPASVWWTRPRS